MKEDYQKQVEKLTKLVDGGVDPVDFITASEESLKADLDAAKVLTKAGSDPKVCVLKGGTVEGGEGWLRGAREEWVREEWLRGEGDG